MSQAKQCDRCGMLYVPYGLQANDSVIVHRNCELVDLCPTCYKELKVWLANDEDIKQKLCYTNMRDT